MAQRARRREGPPRDARRRRLRGRAREMAKRVLRLLFSWRTYFLVPVVLAAGGVAIYFILSAGGQEINKIIGAIATGAGALGITVSGARTTVGRWASKVEEPLWGAEIDVAIAGAITTLDRSWVVRFRQRPSRIASGNALVHILLAVLSVLALGIAELGGNAGRSRHDCFHPRAGGDRAIALATQGAPERSLLLATSGQPGIKPPRPALLSPRVRPESARFPVSARIESAQMATKEKPFSCPGYPCRDWIALPRDRQAGQARLGFLADERIGPSFLATRSWLTAQAMATISRPATCPCWLTACASPAFWSSNVFSTGRWNAPWENRRTA